MKRCLLLLILLAMPPVLLANGSEIIYKTDHEYMFAEFSSIERGKALLSNSHAVTRHEFHKTVSSRHMGRSKGFSFDLSPTIRPFVAGYYSPYYHYDNYPVPLMYLFESQQDICTLAMSMALDDGFFLKYTYSVGASAAELSGPGIYHPFSLGTYAAGDSPDEGYLSFANDSFSVTFGRFKGGIGHGLSGNLFQNSRAPYYDQIQLSLYAPFVKVYYMLGTSNYQLKGSEHQVQNRAPITQNYVKTWGSYAEKTSRVQKESDNIKMFAFHRIELKPLTAIRLGLGEMNLVGGKFPDFNMMNPAGMYHDTYDANYHSYTFLFDIAVVPFKHHMFFFEFLSNDIQAPGERNGDPTAVGFQGGYWYILPVESAMKHRIGIEATHLDTWTYSDIVPYLTMYQRQMRRESRYDIPLGYAYGGDCEHVGLYYTALAEDGFILNLSIQRLHKGEVRFQMKDGEMPYADAYKYQGRPSGVVEMWSTVEGSSTIPFNDMIDIDLKGHYSFIENFQNNKENDVHLLYVSSGITVEF
ncbi:MAG: hypothetical protein ACOC2H_08775 [Spirochaetota bacterium]